MKTEQEKKKDVCTCYYCELEGVRKNLTEQLQQIQFMLKNVAYKIYNGNEHYGDLDEF